MSLAALVFLTVSGFAAFAAVQWLRAENLYKTRAWAAHNAQVSLAARRSVESPVDALDMLNDQTLCPTELRGFSWNLIQRFSSLTVYPVPHIEDFFPSVSGNASLLVWIDSDKILRLREIPSLKERFLTSSSGFESFEFLANKSLLVTQHVDQTVEVVCVSRIDSKNKIVYALAERRRCSVSETPESYNLS